MAIEYGKKQKISQVSTSLDSDDVAVTEMVETHTLTKNSSISAIVFNQ